MLALLLLLTPFCTEGLFLRFIRFISSSSMHCFQSSWDSLNPVTSFGLDVFKFDISLRANSNSS